jgi:hypothetical protein
MGSGHLTTLAIVIYIGVGYVLIKRFWPYNGTGVKVNGRLALPAGN